MLYFQIKLKELLIIILELNIREIKNQISI